MMLNLFLYDNLAANLEAQAEGWRAKALTSESFEERRHWASKAEGVEYAIRLLEAFEPEFPGSEA